MIQKIGFDLFALRLIIKENCEVAFLESLSRGFWIWDPTPQHNLCNRVPDPIEA